jgi:hypothetical protein
MIFNSCEIAINIFFAEDQLFTMSGLSLQVDRSADEHE